MRYGFIGLGHLGAKLAASLARNGFDLVVNDVRPESAAPVTAAGAKWAPTLERSRERSMRSSPACPPPPCRSTF
jgi:3-hydroxyisobutyrate dehydrogenase